MVCDPNNNLLHPVGPPIPIPGFGIPIAPIQAPVPGFTFPSGFPEDLLDLLDNLTIPWPGGMDISPKLDDLMNNILKYLSNIFSQLAPFLSLYSFIQALLNMVLCVIDVLCAIPNPWALIRAIRRLIKTCLPPFLDLFPWFALLLMILSIILLIIALIIYVISRIIQIIEDLIENLILMGEGVTLQDPESTAAVAIKIASLFCILDGLLAVFGAIASIIAIINALSQTTFGGLCGGGSNDCCSDDICPPFIRDNPDGIAGTQGKLTYYSEITPNFPTDFFTRPESWQFVNENSSDPYQFRNVITALPSTYAIQGRQVSGFGDIFWPDGIAYDSDTSLRRAPYTVDLTLKDFDPSVFNPDDSGVVRTMIVKNTIVERKPYIGVRNQENDFDFSNQNGTFRLLAGEVEEEDGTPYLIDGEQATLEDLIHFDSSNSGQAPNSDDGYVIQNIEFNWNINHPALVDYNLITIGCIPEISNEVDIINATVPAGVADRLGDAPIPTPDELLECATAAIQSMRDNGTVENVTERGADLVACLEKYKDDLENAFCKVFCITVDPFSTEVAAVPDLQFVSRPIEAQVILRDTTGTNIGENIPDSCIDELEDKLEGMVTFGEISDFKYDGYGTFVADITSDEPGSGELTVSWDGNIISRILNRDSVELNTVIEEVVVPYTFVGGRANPKVRRDAGDVDRGDS